MKLFMNGTASVPQGTLSFMPEEIFLSKEEGKIGDPDEIEIGRAHV